MVDNPYLVRSSHSPIHLSNLCPKADLLSPASPPVSFPPKLKHEWISLTQEGDLLKGEGLSGMKWMSMEIMNGDWDRPLIFSSSDAHIVPALECILEHGNLISQHEKDVSLSCHSHDGLLCPT